jgi:hypothetical protein
VSRSEIIDLVDSNDNVTSHRVASSSQITSEVERLRLTHSDSAFRDWLLNMRKNVRKGVGMTDVEFSVLLRVVYQGMSGVDPSFAWVNEDLRTAAQHARHALRYVGPDGAQSILVTVLVKSTKDEAKREARGLELFSLLQSMHGMRGTLRRAEILRFMNAYYPGGAELSGGSTSRIRLVRTPDGTGAEISFDRDHL